MKNSLSRRLFQKYGLPPRGYQWGATSFLPTQGMSRQWCCCHERIVFANNIYIEGREQNDFGNRRSSMQGLRILHGAMWLK